MTARLPLCTCPRARHTHGTTRMRTLHKCPCMPCRNANSLYRKETRDLRRAREGRWVDPAGPRQKLLLLREAGMTTAQVQLLTGISKSTQTILAVGYPDGTQMTRMRRELAEKLNAVTFRELAAVQRAPRDHETVPAGQARIQLQALTAAGWAPSALADRSGVPQQTLHRVLRGYDTNERYRQMITACYGELYGVVPPRETPAQKQGFTRAVMRARQRNWSPAMAELADYAEAA